MNEIYKIIKKSNSRQKTFLFVSYVINIILVSIFMMMATGTSNVTNETLSKSDYQQLMLIITSIISVALISIVFFQWIISMLFKALFDSRKQFNINVRLMGVKKSVLASIYFKELLSMQLLVIPLGALFAWLFYYIIACSIGLNEKFIGINQILFSLFIHCLVTSISILITFKNAVNNSPIEELRNSYSKQRFDRISRLRVLSFISGVLVFTFTFSTKYLSISNATFWLIQSFYFLSFVLMYDVIMILAHYLLITILKKLKFNYFLLSEYISNGYFKYIKTVSIMIIFSATIFLGLQMMFHTVRDVGLSVVNENIHYSSFATFDNLLDISIYNENKKQSEIYLGLRFKSISATGFKGYINGIDSKFFSIYENIGIDTSLTGDLSEQSILSKLDEPDWNGILLPQFMISKKDIGKNYVANIDGNEISFIIVGGYLTNNFGQLNFFVSRSYLEKKLDVQEQFNVAYFMNNEIAEKFFSQIGSPKAFISKYDIKMQSYNHAVGGTELIELTAIIVIVCALLMLLNYLVITAKQNCMDIARFRGIGLSKSKIFRIYGYQIIFMLFKSLIFTIPFSILLAKIGSYSILAPAYFTQGITMLPHFVVLLFLAIGSLSLLTGYMTIRKAVFTGYVDILRDTE